MGHLELRNLIPMQQFQGVGDMVGPASWIVELENIFAGDIGQEPIEEAMDQLAGVTSADLAYHERVIGALNAAIDSARSGNEEVVSVINNGGGYLVQDAKTAHSLLTEVRDLYMVEYNRWTSQDVGDNSDP